MLVLGTLVDMVPPVLIATPIPLPVMQSFGVDPVHFGMIMLLNLGMGLIAVNWHPRAWPIVRCKLICIKCMIDSFG